MVCTELVSLPDIDFKINEYLLLVEYRSEHNESSLVWFSDCIMMRYVNITGIIMSCIKGIDALTYVLRLNLKWHKVKYDITVS